MVVVAVVAMDSVIAVNSNIERKNDVKCLVATIIYIQDYVYKYVSII